MRAARFARERRSGRAAASMSDAPGSPFAPGARLSPEELREAGERLFGRWGWQTRLAETLEVDGSTVRRWVSGAVAVPPPAKVAIRLLLEQRGFDLARRADADPPPPQDWTKRPQRPRSGRKGGKG